MLRIAGRAGIGEGDLAYDRPTRPGELGALEPLKEDLRDEVSTDGGGNMEVELAGVEGVKGCWPEDNMISSLSLTASLVEDSASLAAVDSRRKCLERDCELGVRLC